MLKYASDIESEQQWSFEEADFDMATLGKCESIMSQGNGYMGLRATLEEDYLSQKRGFFVNGTFNRFSDKEVSELPNLPDLIGVQIVIDGARFDLQRGKLLAYKRKLNLKNGFMMREIDWVSPGGKRIRLTFERFVSLSRLHVMGSRIRISCDQELTVSFHSGINGQVTNTGAQHFDEEDMRFFEKKYLQYNTVTTQSKILVSLNTTHRLSVSAESSMLMDRRRMEQNFTSTAREIELEKLSVVCTSVDKEFDGMDFAAIKAQAHRMVREAADMGFDNLCAESAGAWLAEVWDRYPFVIRSSRAFDLLALRFAVYHLAVMTPRHDRRMGIGAKGLSGEGYKGHSFWDTEIFILPFYIYSNPAVARSLLEYRYLGLQGARKKARENGCIGAMYPWEAAWPDDGEVTPVWGAVDVVTGERTKIWSGFIEIHITCDVALAVLQYYQVTGDQDFMDRYGYEILFDTAIFWASRYEWNGEKQRYEINDVVGPDEYKEHANNNAFTNHVSAENLRLALQFREDLKKGNPALYEALDQKLGLERQIPMIEERLSKIYLPQPNGDLVIPQDDAYLSLRTIDLTKYKAQREVGLLFHDYNLEQVNKIQVSKQADVLMLLYQLESLFPAEVKRANFDYYEPRTLHDSSLSLSTHSILANDLGQYATAYELFRRAGEIDLGPSMTSSDMGVHAASLGGLWQCVVMGFGGVRLAGGKLRVRPRLPEQWEQLQFRIHWQGKPLDFTVTRNRLVITSDHPSTVRLTALEREYELTDRLELPLA